MHYFIILEICYIGYVYVTYEFYKKNNRNNVYSHLNCQYTGIVIHSPDVTCR